MTCRILSRKSSAGQAQRKPASCQSPAPDNFPACLQDGRQVAVPRRRTDQSSLQGTSSFLITLAAASASRRLCALLLMSELLRVRTRPASGHDEIRHMVAVGPAGMLKLKGSKVATGHVLRALARIEIAALLSPQDLEASGPANSLPKLPNPTSLAQSRGPVGNIEADKLAGRHWLGQR